MKQQIISGSPSENPETRIIMATISAAIIIYKQKNSNTVYSNSKQFIGQLRLFNSDTVRLVLMKTNVF